MQEMITHYSSPVARNETERFVHPKQSMGVEPQRASKKTMNHTIHYTNNETKPETMSDTMLVEYVLQGNVEAFSLLVERYKDTTYHLIYRMLNNIPETEDVTQETFVRAYTQLSSYQAGKAGNKFSTWLFSIASHLAIDHLRRRRFLMLPIEDVPHLEGIVDHEISPEQSVLQGERQDEMQVYLHQLPQKYRTIILLRYWQDLSYDEIANTLKLTPTLVKARLHRARKLLARFLQKNPAFA
jgi:RNA polymerase sigma-70 factor (ECF subfamily)